MKNKKLKQTAIFIGIFLAAILLTFIFVRVFRPPPAPEEPTIIETTTAEIETTTAWEYPTTAEEDSTTNPESTIVPVTVTVPGTTTRDTTPTTRTSTRTTSAPPRTTASPSTTRASATTTKPLVTTTRTTTRTTTTRPSTTTTRTTTTQTTTTNASDSLIAFGIDYGKSIGLTYRPQLTQGGEVVGATQQQIRDKLNQAKAAGATQFNVWAERQANGTYHYYIAKG